MTIKTVIKTEAEYDKMVDRLIELSENDPQPGTAAGDELELIALLVKNYDDKHTTFENPTPLEAIRFRMEQEGLRPVDMKKYFGETSKYYKVMNHTRSLSLSMIRRLHEGLNISADCLIAPTKKTSARLTRKTSKSPSKPPKEYA
ncbi:MAG: transcriptional regulator [Lentisphaerae bacterium]|nr:transcriptional regulator [Lentisphaerota bacterium]